MVCLVTAILFAPAGRFCKYMICFYKSFCNVGRSNVAMYSELLLGFFLLGMQHLQYYRLKFGVGTNFMFYKEVSSAHQGCIYLIKTL